MSLESLDRAVKGTIDHSVGDIIAKYGDTQSIAMAVQRGEIKNVTNAVMAGMAIDRIAANALKPPEMTVAQEVLSVQPQMGLAAAQQAQPQGLDQIPISEGMFTAANGGIVAFQAGGTPIERLLKMMNGQERAEYQMTGKIPERLQNLTQPQAASGEAYGGADSVFAKPAVDRPIDMTFNNAAPTPRGRVAAAPSGASNLPSTAQTAAQQAAVPTPEPTIEDLVKQDLEMRNRILGVDPTRAKLKELYEKQEKSAEEDSRKDQAMRLIEAGLGIAGGTSPYFAANLAGATPALKGYGEDVRARRKEGIERAKGMAELEGMERREKAEVLGQTMARRREDKKIKEEREFRKELVRLEASLKPEDFNRYAARILEKGTPEQKAAVEKLIARNRGSETFTYEDAAKLVDDRLSKNPFLIKQIQDREKAAGRPVPDEDTVRRRLIEQERRAAGVGTGAANSDLLRRADAIIGSQ